MSTRGAIARVDGDGWIGRYQHSDSYPTHLGRQLWKVLREDFRGDVGKFLTYAIDEHSGWSHFEGPHDPDRHTACYCHGWRSEEGGYLSEHGACSEDCDPLMIEWVYVFDPTKHVMTILTHHRSNTGPGVNLDWDKNTWYRHIYVGQVKTDGPEPDWDALERSAYPEEESA